MKKTLAIILSVLMVVCMMPGMAFATDPPSGGDGGNSKPATITESAIKLYTDSTTTTEVNESNLVYTGDVIEPTVVVKIGESTTSLTKDTDYKVDYVKSDPTLSLADAGTFTVKVTGINNYDGQGAEKKYKINPKPITEDNTIDILNPKAGDTTLASIKVDNKTLTVGKDYTVSLSPSEIVAGSGNSAEIMFKNNYSGKVTKTFSAKYDLAEYYTVVVTKKTGVTSSSYTYNRSKQGENDYDVKLKTKKELPTGVEKLNENASEAGTVVWTNNTNITTITSKPTVTVTVGNDAWVGSVSAEANFTIIQKSLTASDISVTIDSASGLPLVEDNRIKLKEGTDYTVSLSGGNYVITGKGNYTGTRSINGAATSLNNCTIIFDGFTAGGYPKFIVKYGSTTLSEYSDYKLTYSPSYTTFATSYTVTLSPGSNGTYYGSKYQTISTSATNNLANCSITVSPTTSNYTGYQIKPTVTVYNGYSVVSSAYYDVSYYNNINPGTATVTVTGKGLYYGTKSTYFTITNNYNLANCTATLSQTTYTADGYAKRPTVTVKDGYTTLSPYSDYTVDYKDNVLPGIASVVLTGKGKYTGTSKIVTFTITGLTQTLTVDKDKYIKYLSSDSFKVNPKATGDGTGFSYTSSNNSVVTVNSYTGEISIVGTGRAEIKISTIGNKRYTPVTKVVTVDVKPKKPSFKVSSNDYGKLTTRITKVAGATKYQIRYGRMGSYKSVYVSQDAGGDSTVSRTVKANHGKAYFVKVRSYKTMSDGTKVWGNWTVTKKVYVK